MKKVIFVVVTTLFLNGCFQVIAFITPAATGATSGKMYQSAISYSLSYGVQKTTGKTIIENVIDIGKNPNGKGKIAKNDENEVLINSLNTSISKSVMLTR